VTSCGFPDRDTPAARSMGGGGLGALTAKGHYARSNDGDIRSDVDVLSTIISRPSPVSVKIGNNRGYFHEDIQGGPKVG
jgi:hypothetical protein